MTRASLAAYGVVCGVLAGLLSVTAAAAQDRHVDDAASARSRRASRLVQLADAKVRAGDPGSAVGFYREAVGVDPRFVAAYMGLARAYRLVDREVDAIEALRVGASRIPRSIPMSLLHAEVLQEMGSKAEALSLLRALAAWAPDHPEVHWARAEAARAAGAWSESLASYRALQRLAQEGRAPAADGDVARHFIRALVRLATLDPASRCEGSALREALCE